MYAITWRSNRVERKTGLVLSIAILFSALIGFAILFTAPGNAVRSAIGLPPPGLGTLIINANLNTILFTANWLKDHIFLAGIAFFLPALSGFAFYKPLEEKVWLVRRELTILRGLIISLILLYLVLLSSFATGYYALSANLPDRAQLVPAYFLTLAVMLWGYWSGSLLKGLLPAERSCPAALKTHRDYSALADVSTALYMPQVIFTP
jgi:hypothetical protein